MKPRLQATLALGALAVLAWIGYQTFHAGSDIPPQRGGGITQLNAGSANGKRIDGKSWSLDYRSATLTPDGSSAQIEHIRDGVILRNGKPYMHMQAEHVTANVATNNFSVSGPVSFVEVGGQRRRLETVDAHYDGLTQTLTLNHPTTIHQGTATVVVRTATLNFRSGESTFGRIVGTM